MRYLRAIVAWGALVSSLVACDADLDTRASSATPSQIAFGHEVDSALDPDHVACQIHTTLDFLNDPATEVEDIEAIGVHKRAAMNLAAYSPYANMDEIDEVPQVGPVALDQLSLWAKWQCVEE